MGDRAPSWEDGECSSSQIYHDEDVVFMDAPPKRQVNGLILALNLYEHGDRPALDDVHHSVNREEEDVRNLAIIEKSDKERRSKAQKSRMNLLMKETREGWMKGMREEMMRTRREEIPREEAIKEAGYDFEKTEIS